MSASSIGPTSPFAVLWYLRSFSRSFLMYSSGISAARLLTGSQIRTNWAMALARGNACVILSNLRFVRGGAADADRYGQFSDQHSRWNKKREEYRYAYEEFRGPRMGGFGGRHCR